MALKIRQPELTIREQQRIIEWYKAYISYYTFMSKNDMKLIEKIVGKPIQEIIKPVNK